MRDIGLEMYDGDKLELSAWEMYCDEEDEYFESMKERDEDDDDEVIEDPYPEVFCDEAPGEEAIFDVPFSDRSSVKWMPDRNDVDVDRCKKIIQEDSRRIQASIQPDNEKKGKELYALDEEEREFVEIFRKLSRREKSLLMVKVYGFDPDNRTGKNVE